MVQLFKIPRPLFWSKHNSVSHTTHTHQDSQWSLTLDLTKPNIDITSNLRAHVLYDQSFASLRSPQPSGSAPQQPGVLEKLDRWSYLSIMSDQLRLSTRNQTGWRFWTQRILVKFHHHHKKNARRKQARTSHYKPVLMSCIPTGHEFRVLIKELLFKKHFTSQSLCFCISKTLSCAYVTGSVEDGRAASLSWSHSRNAAGCLFAARNDLSLWSTEFGQGMMCNMYIIYLYIYVHIYIYVFTIHLHSFIYINMCEYMYIYYWRYDDIHDYDVYICMPWSINGKWLVVIPPSLGIPHNRYVYALVLINLGWWPRNLWIDWWGI